MVQVTFEPACLVAPDGPAGSADGWRPDTALRLTRIDALTHDINQLVTLGGGVGEHEISPVVSPLA